MSHKFFFELQIYKKISPKRLSYLLIYLLLFIWLSYLFPFQKRFAKTGEFRPSEADPCLNTRKTGRSKLGHFDFKIAAIRSTNFFWR